MEQEIIEEVEAPEVEEQEPIPTVDPEIESEARTMGWIPKEEFRGRAENWRPADEYVKRGRELMPIMRSQMTKYEREIESLKGTVESQKQTTEKLLKMSEKVTQQAYERAKAELTSKQEAAVRDGDVDTWQRIEAEKDKLVKPEPVVHAQSDPPEFVSWAQSNDWYKTDPDLTVFADAYGQSIKDKNLPYNQFLNEVEKKVKEVFKHKFENPNRNTPPAVDTAALRGTTTPSGKKSYNDLPADAKRQCDKWVNDGTFKSREAYVQSYFEEE